MAAIVHDIVRIYHLLLVGMFALDHPDIVDIEVASIVSSRCGSCSGHSDPFTGCCGSGY